LVKFPFAKFSKENEILLRSSQKNLTKFAKEWLNVAKERGKSAKFAKCRADFAKFAKCGLSIAKFANGRVLYCEVRKSEGLKCNFANLRVYADLEGLGCQLAN
jgi:hypothetical protein